MPIRFFCDHCRQMLKIGTSKMGSAVDCPRCRKPVVVPPQSVPQAEQMYQLLKAKCAKEKAAPPAPVNNASEPALPESAWDELGENVNDADLNQWIDELWAASPPDKQQESFPAQLLPLRTESDVDIAFLALQKRQRLTVTLLYVSVAVALFAGIVFGILIHTLFVPSSRTSQHAAGAEFGTNEVAGTLYFRNENGDKLPDVDAVIICLPMDRPMTQLLAPQGLRPDDAMSDHTAQLIKEVGGIYARADVNGAFTLHYREGTRYFVVLISACQKRKDEMKQSIRQGLSRYFRDPEQFGENCLFTDEHEWSGGKWSFRYTFEFGESSCYNSQHMKCQKCDKPATFHISELTGAEPKELHLCEEHAREYLNRSAVQGDMAGSLVASLAKGLPKQVSLNKAAEELRELDQQTCPICGISFHEFRSRGYLGCPHDYDFFNKQIDAFILNIHGAHEHTGKTPPRRPDNVQDRMLLIKFRRDLDDAVQYEDYERATKLRDKIKEIERE